MTSLGLGNIDKGKYFRMNNIVFIEGVSGVGKTTVTTLLYEELQSRGYKASCYLEGANNNPLDPFYGTYPPAIPIIEFFEIYLQHWQNFMETKFRNDFMIVDGTLLHHQINDLIREYSASDEVIANYISNLLNTILQLNPIIFYLSSDNVGHRLVHARRSRSQSAPTEERIRFWENRKRVDLYVLEKLPIDSHILDVSNGWGSILRTMVEHITIFGQEFMK